MSEVGTQQRLRRAGVIGAVVGLAAAGIAAGATAGRMLARRGRNGGDDDPYVREVFGRLPYDEQLVVTTRDGVGLHVEIVDPADGVELEASFAARVAATAPVTDPTVIFVHGFCLGMGAFHFQRKELTQRGDWRAVFYDQAGHGRSDRLPTGEYELPVLAEALRAVVEATTPAGPVVLVGHSMGGMVIMSFAEQYPDLYAERVAGTVLMSTSAGRLEATRPMVPDLLTRVGRPLWPVVNGATRMTGGMIDWARRAATDLAWLMTRKYGFGGEQPSPSLVSYAEQLISQTPVETVARYLRTLHDHQWVPTLAVLRDKPVLLICGEQDLITPVAHSAEIRERLPHAELMVVPDSGHLVLLERPEEVNAALLEFLEGLA